VDTRYFPLGIANSFFDEADVEVLRLRRSSVWYVVLVNVVPEAADTLYGVKAKENNRHETKKMTGKAINFFNWIFLL